MFSEAVRKRPEPFHVERFPAPSGQQEGHPACGGSLGNGTVESDGVYGKLRFPTAPVHQCPSLAFHCGKLSPVLEGDRRC